MPQQIDDFTIVLPELTGMGACEVYDRLWGMVERYEMTAPLTISVVDAGLTLKKTAQTS